MDANTNLTTEFRKEITYNRENHDYDLFLDGEYVGSAGSHSEGEYKLNELIYAELTH